jgi:hypothetical protein
MCTIDSEKLADVTRILNQDVDPKVTGEVVKVAICGDWNAGAEWQEWIDNSTAQEIADWLALFYGPASDFEEAESDYN